MGTILYYIICTVFHINEFIINRMTYLVLIISNNPSGQHLQNLTWMPLFTSGYVQNVYVVAYLAF